MARLPLALAFLLYAASASAASGNPAPAASPAPRRAAVRRQPVVIHPRSNLPVTRFEVAKVPGRSDQLEIRFVSADPKLRLDPAKSIVIQLNTPRSLVITPSVITSSEWPKGATRMVVSFKGATTKGVWIDGAATYTVCNGKSCKQTETPIRTDFK
jgi:hypothetical protein